MKPTKNRVIVALALLSVVSLGIAWQEHGRRVELQAASADNEDRADLRRNIARLEQRNRELGAELVAKRAAVREPAAEAVAEPAPREADQNRGRGGPRGDMRAMMDRPEVQRLRTLQQKVALDTRFAPLFKSLNLSADKVAGLKSLLVEREASMMDLMDAARQQGIDPRSDPAAFRKLVATAQAENDSAIKALLGEDGFAQYDQYQKTQPQRAVVSQLQQSLSYTSEPLSDAQAAQLVQILGSTAPANGAGQGRPADGFGGGPLQGGPGGGGGFGGGFGGGGGGGGGGATITTAAVTLAQTVLSPSQLQALEQLQQVQQAQQAVQQLMRDSGGGGAGGGAQGGGPPAQGGARPGGG